MDKAHGGHADALNGIISAQIPEISTRNNFCRHTQSNMMIGIKTLGLNLLSRTLHKGSKKAYEAKNMVRQLLYWAPCRWRFFSNTSFTQAVPCEGTDQASGQWRGDGALGK